MNFNNIPRTYTLGFILMTVVVLIVAVAIEPGTLGFRDQTDYDALRKQAELENRQYAELLAHVEVDYEASKQFLQKIATEDLVREQVETTLQTNQRVTIPTVADSEIKIASRNDRDSVINYFNSIGSIIDNYDNQVAPSLPSLFDENGDATSL